MASICFWMIMMISGQDGLKTNSPFAKAEPAKDISDVFKSSKGWIGADGNYSVKISGDKALWFFSDTLSSQTKCNTIMIRCCHYGKTISTFHAGRPLYDCPTS
jgi:hypothetical protein